MEIDLFVPGRICLFGEHSDWASGYRRFSSGIEKGYCIVCGTEQGLYARVKPNPTHLVITSTGNDGKSIGPVTIPMEEDVLLREAAKGEFFSYAAGVAYYLLKNNHVGGIEIDNYKTTLPIQKGLSSSAAVTVLVARAFNRIYDLRMTKKGEMEVAYQGEICTPSRCGRMDQAVAFGDVPVLMTFDGENISVSEIRVNKPLHYVLVDLGASKDTMTILSDLNHCFPVAQSEQHTAVQDALGKVNKDILMRASAMIKEGDAQGLGNLMVEAQAKFDAACMPVCEELKSPVLHKTLAYEPLKELIYGGKGVGSQGDGTAQFLAKSEEDQDKLVSIIEKDLGMSCLKLTMHPQRRIVTAVIPAAGFGPALFPATKATKLEFFPIIDPHDDICKPAFLLLVEEAYDAGLDVVLVVAEEDLNQFQRFFREQPSPQNFNKLSAKLQRYSRRISEIGRRVKFVVQKKQEGLGHAVLCARDHISKSEPFLIMLGDHLYRSNSAVSCTQQMLEAYQKYGSNIVGLKITPEAQVSRYGTVCGVWTDTSEQKLLSVRQFNEKPTVPEARQSLRVDGLEDDQYLTLFGLYVVNPSVFEHLDHAVRNNVRTRGEFQLTSALDNMRQEEGFGGVVVKGRRYDFGSPESYMETITTFK